MQRNRFYMNTRNTSGSPVTGHKRSIVDKEPKDKKKAKLGNQRYQRQLSSSVRQGFRPEGCNHYQRKCQLRCEVCMEFFPCRFCHDLAMFEQSVNQQIKQDFLDKRLKKEKEDKLKRE